MIALMSEALRQPPERMTVAEFLPWAEEARARGEGRYELVDGIVHAMNAERVAHGETKLAVAVALLSSIRRAGLPCHVMPDGATVVVDDSTAYEPDALVYCGERANPAGIAISDPIILVEVISPSTGHIDRGDKLKNYFKIPAVQHYLMVYPDQRMVVHHQRADAGTLTTRISHDGELRLDPRGLIVPVAELFAVPG